MRCQCTQLSSNSGQACRLLHVGHIGSILASKEVSVVELMVLMDPSLIIIELNGIADVQNTHMVIDLQDAVMAGAPSYSRRLTTE